MTPNGITRIDAFTISVRIVVLCVVALGCIGCIDQNELQRSLLNGYNTNIAPTVGRDTLIADVKMNLLSLTEFDEITGVLTTNSFVTVEWIDERLKWSLDDNNITETYMRQEQIWLPDLVVVNSAEEFKSLGYSNLHVQIKNDGQVTWWPGVRALTLCHVDTELFPFDKQTCSIQFMSWSQRRPQSDIRASKQVINLMNFGENGVWIISNTSVTSLDIGSATMLKFNLELTRRPKYYITAMMMPVLILSFLNCFGFLLPQASGEKMTYSTAILLSYTVLLTYANDALPKTSKHSSVFVNYIAVMLGLSCVSVVCTVLGMLSYSSKTSQEEPRDHVSIDANQSLRDCKDTNGLDEEGLDSVTSTADLPGESASTYRNNRITLVSVKRYTLMFLGYFVNYFMFALVTISTIVVTVISLDILLNQSTESTGGT